MKKKLLLALITGTLAFQIVGCNKTENQDMAEMESAVEDTTADSDVSVEDALPEIMEEEDQEDTDVTYEKANISVSLPKGFSADKNEEGLYVSRNYLKDSATISYVISDGDKNNTKTSAEEYQAMLKEEFLNAYGDEVAIAISQYDKIKVDGRPGLKIKLEYELKGDIYEQLIYEFYNGDESHNLTFTQQKDAGLMEKFETCGDSIHFVAAE